eukprot:scaffold41752_cov89-Skeletonema_dohrnii-CCMP3373.AAC.1
MLPSAVVSIVLSRPRPVGNTILLSRNQGKREKREEEDFQIPGWKWAYLKRGDIWHFEGASPSNSPQVLINVQ